MLLADAGSGPSLSAKAGVDAGTSSGAGASTSEGAESIIGDGAEAESVAAGAGSTGEVGDGSMIGDASKGSSIAVGTSDIMLLNGIKGAHGDSGKRGGGVANGGEAGLEKGKRGIFPSSFGPRNSSTSLRRFLALFAGGVFTSCSEGGGGVVGDGGAMFGSVVSSQTGEATSNKGGGGQSRLLLAAVAAGSRHLQQLRRRWWRLPAVAVVVVMAGMVHITMMVCRPAAWLTATRALRPLSIHCSYCAKKSVTEANDGGLGLAGSPTQVATPPLTTLAHLGEATEVGSEEKDPSADVQPAQLARLRPLRRGRRGSQRLGRMTIQLLQHCYLPRPEPVNPKTVF